MKIGNNQLSLNNLFQADSVGALASALCLVHCIATPFLFIAMTCTSACCESSPIWWRWLDPFFLVIAFFAVYRASKTTSKSWMKYAMWISWVTLLMIILNEKLQLMTLFESAIYYPAMALVGLHLYNLKYCQCKEDHCCALEDHSSTNH